MGAIFSARIQNSSGALLAASKMCFGSLSRGVKRPDSDVDHPPPSSAEVKERVEPYIYIPFALSWQVHGEIFNFTSKVLAFSGDM